MLFVFDSIPDQYKTLERCETIVSKEPFAIVFCPNKYKTQGMFDSVEHVVLKTLL